MAPGETRNITVELRNEGKKAWKEGSYIALAKKQKKTPKQKKGDTAPVVPAVPLEAFTMHVAESLAPNTGASYEVPLTMMANIPADPTRVFDVNLTLFDGKKKHFGMLIPIKVMCVESGTMVNIMPAALVDQPAAEG